MRIVREGPSRQDLLAALGSVTSVRFGSVESGVDVVVSLFCPVGDRPFNIDMPRVSGSDPRSAWIVGGRITGGNFNKVAAAGYVTFAEDGTLLCAVIVKKAGAMANSSLDFAHVLIGLVEGAMRDWFGPPTS